MSGFGKRFLNFLGDEDRSIASLLGCEWWQTISGSIGRACGYGGGQRQWWGTPARVIVDGMPWFGNGHCQRWAEIEARIAAECETA